MMIVSNKSSRLTWCWLDDGEHCRRGVLQNRKPSDVRNVFSRSNNCTSGVSCLLHCAVTIIDGEVDHPVRRYRPHHGRDLVHAANTLTVVLENRVLHRSGKNFRLPAK